MAAARVLVAATSLLLVTGCQGDSTDVASNGPLAEGGRPGLLTDVEFPETDPPVEIHELGLHGEWEADPMYDVPLTYPVKLPPGADLNPLPGFGFTMPDHVVVIPYLIYHYTVNGREHELYTPAILRYELDSVGCGLERIGEDGSSPSEGPKLEPW